jgi:hypothetical protein
MQPFLTQLVGSSFVASVLANYAHVADDSGCMGYIGSAESAASSKPTAKTEWLPRDRLQANRIGKCGNAGSFKWSDYEPEPQLPNKQSHANRVLRGLRGLRFSQ